MLADDIGDNDEAWTRFILLAQTGHLPAPTGADPSATFGVAPRTYRSIVTPRPHRAGTQGIVSKGRE